MGGPSLAPDVQVQMWQRWKAGEKTSEIAAALGEWEQTIRATVGLHGGIEPRARTRSVRTLSLKEREEILRGLWARNSLRQIAKRLGRAPSTVSREISRNARQWWRYRALASDGRAWEKALRPKLCHLAKNPQLARLVAQKLKSDWSPQQISGWLERQYGNDDSMRVSHETIYKSLFIQARGVLKKQLSEHLRRGRMIRRSRHYRGLKGDGRGQILNAVSIRERGPEAEDRAVPGHWEGDLIEGSNNSQIATLVERHSRFVVLVKVRRSDTKTVVSALTRRVRKLPVDLRRSLTWDRGKEMASHQDFAVATDVKVYFADPYCPWQRGSNENTNGLLRQYFPKRTDLSGFSQVQLDKVALKLNQRPRETLGFETPAHKLSARVASTG